MANIKEYLQLKEALYTAYANAKQNDSEEFERYRASLIILVLKTEWRIRELSRLSDKTPI